MSYLAIVEDNPDNRLLLRTILESEFGVREFGDGPSVLEAIREERPTVIFLDISLPRMDGVQVLQEIRRDSDLKGIPIVAVTAHAMEGDREKFIELGFDDYLSKPILDDEELISIARRYSGLA